MAFTVAGRARSLELDAHKRGSPKLKSASLQKAQGMIRAT